MIIGIAKILSKSASIKSTPSTLDLYKHTKLALLLNRWHTYLFNSCVRWWWSNVVRGADYLDLHAKSSSSPGAAKRQRWMPVGCHSRLTLYWGRSSCRIWPVTKRICACSVLPGHRKMRNVLPAIPYLDSDPAQLSGCTKFEGASNRVTQSLKKRNVHKILYLFALLGLFVCLFFPNGWTYLSQFFILPWPHIISFLPLPSPPPPLSPPRIVLFWHHQAAGFHFYDRPFPVDDKRLTFLE